MSSHTRSWSWQPSVVRGGRGRRWAKQPLLEVVLAVERQVQVDFEGAIALLAEGVLNAHDVRMMELGETQDLALNTLASRSVAEVILLQHALVALVRRDVHVV